MLLYMAGPARGRSPPAILRMRELAAKAEAAYSVNPSTRYVCIVTYGGKNELGTRKKCEVRKGDRDRVRETYKRTGSADTNKGGCYYRHNPVNTILCGPSIE